MYKALIVDDESIIRIGIKTAIPWETLNISQVFTAGNGIEGLKVISEDKPDILITDISMSGMSGLEMIEEVYKLQPGIKIIVLTGYDSFEYVHRCIKMHVQDFFLKPVDENELAAAIGKLTEQINRERQERLFRRTQGTAEQLYLEKIMWNLAHNRAEDQDFVTLREGYDVWENQSMQAAILVPALHEDGEEFRHLSIKNICIDLFDKQEAGITFQDDNGKIVIAVFQGQELEDTVERMTQLGMLLHDEFGMHPKIILGKEVEGFQNFHLSYSDAIELLGEEENTITEVLRSYQSKNRLRTFYSTFADIKDAIVENIGNTDTVMQLFASFQQAVELHNLSTPLVRKSCFELASSVCFSCFSQSGEFPEAYLQTLTTALAGTGRKEALEHTKNALVQIISIPDEDAYSIVSKVKAIVNEHLSENISVLSIASRLYISPNYLSRLFKKKTGEGCNAYIIRKRIERAKYLLESTSLPSGKIASAVGYQDINYFSIAFKKHVGISPTKYRESIQGQQIGASG